MIDRRLIENFDWAILLTLLPIIGIGLVSLYSAVYPFSRSISFRIVCYREVLYNPKESTYLRLEVTSKLSSIVRNNSIR